MVLACCTKMQSVQKRTCCQASKDMPKVNLGMSQRNSLLLCHCLWQYPEFIQLSSKKTKCACQAQVTVEEENGSGVCQEPQGSVRWRRRLSASNAHVTQHPNRNKILRLPRIWSCYTDMLQCAKLSGSL